MVKGISVSKKSMIFYSTSKQSVEKTTQQFFINFGSRERAHPQFSREQKIIENGSAVFSTDCFEVE